MAVFAVISDIHGCATALRKTVEIATEKYRADYFLLLGDILYHGPRNRIADGYDAQEVSGFLNSYRNRIIAVRGNCDAEVDQMMLEFPIMSDSNQLVFGSHRIFMTHGHLFRPKELPLNEKDLFFSGHTHRVRFEETENSSGNRIICFNPGSVSLPKEPQYGSFGIFDEHRLKLINLDSGEEVMDEQIW